MKKLKPVNLVLTLNSQSAMKRELKFKERVQQSQAILRLNMTMMQRQQMLSKQIII